MNAASYDANDLAAEAGCSPRWIRKTAARIGQAGTIQAGRLKWTPAAAAAILDAIAQAAEAGPGRPTGTVNPGLPIPPLPWPDEVPPPRSPTTPGPRPTLPGPPPPPPAPDTTSHRAPAPARPAAPPSPCPPTPTAGNPNPSTQGDGAFRVVGRKRVYGK